MPKCTYALFSIPPLSEIVRQEVILSAEKEKELLFYRIYPSAKHFSALSDIRRVGAGIPRTPLRAKWGNINRLKHHAHERYDTFALTLREMCFQGRRIKNRLASYILESMFVRGGQAHELKEVIVGQA